MKIPKAILLAALAGAATFASAQDQATPAPQRDNAEVIMLCSVGSNGSEDFLACHTPTRSDEGSSSRGDEASPQDQNAPSSDDDNAPALNSAEAGSTQTDNSSARSANDSPSNNGAASPQSQQPDPDAPQNQVEYGGGGE